VNFDVWHSNVLSHFSRGVLQGIFHTYCGNQISELNIFDSDYCFILSIYLITGNDNLIHFVRPGQCWVLSTTPVMCHCLCPLLVCSSSRLLTDRIVDRHDPEYCIIVRIGSGLHSTVKTARNDRNTDPRYLF
jgi:hypothetical protein